MRETRILVAPLADDMQFTVFKRDASSAQSYFIPFFASWGDLLAWEDWLQ
jgi:hypothetical protein